MLLTVSVGSLLKITKNITTVVFKVQKKALFFQIVLFVFACFTVLLSHHIVQAQVGISPLVIEVQANRGQAEGTITVSNESNAPFRARVYAESFTFTRDGGFEILPSSPNSLTPYLQFSPRELVVPPGVTRRVRLISRFPPSLPSGEYRAVIFTETLNETTDTAGNNVALKTRIGVRFYVRQGNANSNLAVDNATWNPQKKQIQLLVRNTGQASARPSVNWTLKQGSTVVKTGNLDSTEIIAATDRNLLLNYPSQGQPLPSPGQYQLTGELAWGENNSNKLPFSVNLTIPTNATSAQ